MTTMNEEPTGYMPIPTAEQVAEALANVRCYHDMSAELIAPELLANLLAALSAHQSAPVTEEPSPLDVIGYASPGQIEILRELPRTGGMKVKGRKDDRYSEPVVLLSDARAAMISLAARCQQEGAFKTCLECGYQDGHDEICQFHGSNRAAQEQGEVQRLREALERATKLLSAAAGYATKMEPMPAKLLNAIDAELDASTGQEGEP